jgi:hypothetical protein
MRSADKRSLLIYTLPSGGKTPGAGRQEGGGAQAIGGGRQEGQEEEGFLDARAQEEAAGPLIDQNNDINKLVYSLAEAVDDQGSGEPEEPAEAVGLGTPECAQQAGHPVPGRGQDRRQGPAGEDLQRHVPEDAAVGGGEVRHQLPGVPEGLGGEYKNP